MSGSNIGSRVADVLVVGGGHAGCEAALACARLGKDTLLVTGAIDRIAAMSCNPAIGGVGKGHLVKELDALGGEMGRVADDTGIHFRTLNESRGPAVRATRCQSDMERYRVAMTRVVATTPNLRLRQDDVVALHVEDGRAAGVITKSGELLRARRVILTTGTFLGGLLHRGADRSPGGRAGEAPASGLSSSLAAHGLVLGRLKTGTCPRLDARTIRMSDLEEQRPDVPAPRFSFDHAADEAPPLPQVSCRLTRTTDETHAVIRAAVASGEAPLFNGQIGGRGPRYCPSVEDKVVRFAEKESHLVFLEPHGLDTFEVYPNGLSTSLPPKVQLAFLRTMPGLEDVEVTRWGYAVEYDFVEPTQLHASLETKRIGGLFCAGQLNGTTGYEEAAIQGLLAGINAARSLDDKPALVLRRDQAYAGVLVDDLVLKGTDEPYRMFTSRAEHRLLLREDNVAARLLDASVDVGLARAARLGRMRAFEDDVRAELARLERVRLDVTPERNALLAARGSAPMKEPQTLLQLLRRPEVDPAVLFALEGRTEPVDVRVAARVEVEVKYAGYIERAAKDIERDRALDGEAIPDEVFRERLPGISNEVHEKLVRLRPATLGQASRISGMTPAAVGLLAVEVRRRAAAR
jgi:tRNA uridine 5-carboxymethylaminomethyl modification enzyme